MAARIGGGPVPAGGRRQLVRRRAHAEAKALLEAPPNPYKPEENLYLALLGFDAPQGESPVDAGRKRLAVYEDELAAGLKNPEYVLPRLAEHRGRTLPFRGRLDVWATHPVDGKPFVWDGKTREITVQPLGRQPKDRRFGIPVWSPGP